MLVNEIKESNIESLGYKVGKGTKGKGTKILVPSKHFKGFFSVGVGSSKDFKEAMEAKGAKLDELYVKEGSYLLDGETKYFGFGENYPISEAKYNLKELAENDFEGLKSAHIYYKPECVGYFPLSKYKTDKEGQQQMMLDFIEQFENEKLYGEFEDSEYNYECMDFGTSDRNGEYWNGDYCQHHGDAYYAEDTGDCEYVDGRVYDYNETVLDDFWAFGPDEGGWLKELDPDDTISVYSRKGKDWYIGYSLKSRDLYISYKELEDDEVVEEEQFFALFYKPNKELLQKVVDVVQGWKEDIEVRSYIYNQFDENHDNSIVDFNLAKMLYENLSDFRNQIEEEIASWKSDTIANEFLIAYNKVVNENVKVFENKTVEITHNPCVYGSEKPTQKRYNHLRNMERIGRVLGFEIVHTALESESDIFAYAIKKDDEEYHFNIAELIAKDVAGEQTLRSAVEEMLESLEKRKLEMMAQKELFEKASKVFVGVEDSLKSGNCSFGTNEFIARMAIDTSRIGGIRGDELLKMEMSNFTMRAVIHAIANHNQNVA